MPVDQEKLAKLQKLSATNKVGGTRRKINKKGNLFNSNDKDDSRLQTEVHKLHPLTIENVAEANFFRKNGRFYISAIPLFKLHLNVMLQ